MNDPDLFFLHALLCGEQGRRPVFPAKEAAERAFAPRPWEEIVELFQRPSPGSTNGPQCQKSRRVLAGRGSRDAATTEHSRPMDAKAPVCRTRGLQTPDKPLRSHTSAGVK